MSTELETTPKLRAVKTAKPLVEYFDGRAAENLSAKEIRELHEGQDVDRLLADASVQLDQALLNIKTQAAAAEKQARRRHAAYCAALVAED